MGRRTYKRVTLNGNVTLHQRYIYRGYLQIACIDLTRSHHPALWFITWDPTQRIATRPLAIQKDGTWYTYGLDLTKNVCEVFGTTGYIGTAYTYSPFGEVTATGNVEQPIQWSSEFNDSELGTPHFYIAYNSGTEYVYMNTYALEMIKGKLYNIYTRSDLTQTILADTSDGISKASHGIRSNELPFRKIHYLYVDRGVLHPKIENIEVEMDFFSDSHGTIHSSEMGTYIGELLTNEKPTWEINNYNLGTSKNSPNGNL